MSKRDRRTPSASCYDQIAFRAFAALGALCFVAGCGPAAYFRVGGQAGNGFDPPVVGSGGRVGTGGAETGGMIGTGGVGTGGTGTGGMIGSGGAGTGGAGTGGVIGTGGTETGGAGTGGVIGTGGTGRGGGGGAGMGGVIGSGGAGRGGGGGTGMGGTGTGGAGTGAATGDAARYNFEANVQGWMSDPDPMSVPFTSVATSMTQKFAGASSLAGAINATGVAFYGFVVSPPAPAIPAGSTVTYHLFVPVGAMIDYVTPYTQEGAPNYLWTGMGLVNFTAGSWSTFTVSLPANSAPIANMGVRFHTMAAWSGTVYIDSINY